jgi:uncharacterized protein (TIGR02118 family)
MIKFFALIPRLEGLSSQEFHDHWRHAHGSMGRQIPSLRHYVQSHHVPTDLLDADQASYEGIAESIFDSLEDGMAFGQDPYYVKYIQPDEPNFVDQSRLEWLYAEEEVLVSRPKEQAGAFYADAQWLHLDLPTSIKLLQFIRRDGNPNWAGEHDAELGRRIGAFRHVRDYLLSEAHGDDPPWLGARELWWPTLSSFHAGVNSDREAFGQLVGNGGSALTLLVQAERFLR